MHVLDITIHHHVCCRTHTSQFCMITRLFPIRQIGNIHELRTGRYGILPGIDHLTPQLVVEQHTQIEVFPTDLVNPSPMRFRLRCSGIVHITTINHVVTIQIFNLVGSNLTTHR